MAPNNAESQRKNGPVQLDEIDHAIMEQLSRDGRMSVAALAQAVHISRAHCYSRMNRLMETGVITGFTATFDPVRSGRGASAYVMLKTRQHSWRELKAEILKVPEVEHLALVSGSFDVLVLVRAKDNQDLRRLVFDSFQHLPGVVDAQTHIIFEDEDAR